MCGCVLQLKVPLFDSRIDHEQEEWFAFPHRLRCASVVYLFKLVVICFIVFLSFVELKVILVFPNFPETQICKYVPEPVLNFDHANISRWHAVVIWLISSYKSIRYKSVSTQSKVPITSRALGFVSYILATKVDDWFTIYAFCAAESVPWRVVQTCSTRVLVLSKPKSLAYAYNYRNEEYCWLHLIC